MTANIPLKCADNHTVHIKPTDEMPHYCRQCGLKMRVNRSPKHPETITSNQ